MCAMIGVLTVLAQGKKDRGSQSGKRVPGVPPHTLYYAHEIISILTWPNDLNCLRCEGVKGLIAFFCISVLYNAHG